MSVMPIARCDAQYRRLCLPRPLTLALSAAAALCLLGWNPNSAHAGIIPVANTNDSGSGSLRQAIADAAPGDTVSVPAGTYILTSAELSVNKSIAIQGVEARSTTISGNDARRVFHVQVAGTNASISGMTITRGNTSDRGGGVLTESSTSLTVAEAEVTDNLASDTTFIGGGGIWNDGQLTVSSSTFSGNRAIATNAGQFAGGAAIWNQGTMTLVNSTLTGNTAGGGLGYGGGGGLFTSLSDPSSSTVTNTTFSQNTASGSGPAGGGGNIYNEGAGSTTLRNTIIDQGTATVGSNCFGTITTAGHNVESADTCSFNGSGDKKNTDPKLAALADNGGPTQTRALQSGSPAIDAGDNSGCPATDQRGVKRPQGPACDIGAFEVEVPALPAPDKTASDVQNLRFQRRTFAALGSGPSVIATARKKKRKTPKGSRVSYTLAENATVTFTVERAIKGRRKGKKCISKRKKGKRCTIYKQVKGSFTHAGKKGSNRFKFSARVGGKKLRPANYRLVAVATDAAGNRGKAVRKTFRIRR